MVEHSALGNTIQLWSATLSQVEGASEAILDEHERQTLERIKLAEVKLRYLKSHWLLRQIVSRYVGEQAGSLRLAYRDKGKPYLPDHALHFSVSHSHDRWILALAAAGEIGADIEKIEPLAGMQAIIRTYFHPEEQKRLNALEPQQKMVAFYRQWTQMEAFVKMHGIGLYARMNTIRKLDRTLMFEDQPDSLAACEAYPLYPGYIASIAVRGVMLPAVRMAWTPNPNKSSEECELHAQ